MTNDINESQMILSPGDVCTLLQIKESTLRKYALLLQDAGYHFDTNDKGQRAYYEKDVIAFKKLIEIKKSTDMTIEKSANAVMMWFKQSNVSLRVMDEKRYDERHNDDIKELKETVKQQNILLQELMKKMDHQQKYIDEKLEQRDRALMESLKRSQEERKAILQIAEEQKKPRKGLFKRIFSND